MDLESNNRTKANTTRKVKFEPKAQVRRAPKHNVVKSEVVDDADDAKAKELTQRFMEGSLAGKLKAEKKSAPVRVAFGMGASAISDNYGGSNHRYQGKAHISGMREEKEYKEPWDYYSYYPVTLPLRRPYSGNPDLLDEEEFGQPSNFDENLTNPALELGLMDEQEEPRMLFLQLPRTIPMLKHAAGSDRQETSSSSLNPPSGMGLVQKPCRLNELPGGFMGKMLVYRSGAVKLKLGDTLYDVNPGSDCVFAQDVVAVNTEEKHICVMGELNKRAIVTPDVNSILDKFADLE